LGTSDGCVLAAHTGAEWQVVGHGLPGQTITSMAVGPDGIWAGTRDGIYRSTDSGQIWLDASSGLTVRYVRWMTSTAWGVWAGTEPAVIYGWQEGVGWTERSEVAQLRDRHGWWLPYSPEDGCVRGFAAHEATGRAYAAAEVGGVLRSDDGGQTWDLAPGSSPDPRNFQPPPSIVHPDVHSIAVHPSSEDVVCAPTGGGLYRSGDGGTTWALLYSCYCRAVWVDPEDSNQIIFGPADGVSRGGRIERSHDGGQTWKLASGALEVPWPRRMVERFLQIDDELLAVLSNGELLAAPLDTLAWQPFLPEVTGARCAAQL
jgi:hypothetical protein